MYKSSSAKKTEFLYSQITSNESTRKVKYFSLRAPPGSNTARRDGKSVGFMKERDLKRELVFDLALYFKLKNGLKLKRAACLHCICHCAPPQSLFHMMTLSFDILRCGFCGGTASTFKSLSQVSSSISKEETCFDESVGVVASQDNFRHCYGGRSEGIGFSQIGV